MTLVTRIDLANPTIRQNSVAARPESLKRGSATSSFSWSEDSFELNGSTAGASVVTPEQRIADIRREVAAGRYLTADKIDVTVDRLLIALREHGQDAGSDQPSTAAV